MEKPTWTVVKFPIDNSVEAVPTNWIVDDTCFWPPFTSARIRQAIKTQDFSTCWPSYKVEIFRNGTYDNYDMAKEKAKKSEYTSDLNSSDVDIDRNKRRRRLNKKIFDSSSSSEEDLRKRNNPIRNTTRIESPPTFSSNPRAEESEPMNFIDQHDAGFLEEIPCYFNDDSQNSGVARSHLPIENVVTTPKHQANQGPGNGHTMPQDKVNSSSSSKCTCCPHHIQYLRAIFKAHNMTRNLLKEFMEEFKKKNENTSTTTQTVSVFLPFVLPTNSQEDLIAIDDYLKSNDEIFEKAVREIAKMGGKHKYDFIRRAMSSLMTDELASQYSYLGRRQKQCFKKLQIAKVIIDAATKSDETNMTTQEVEEAMSKWLRRATERKNNLYKNRTH